MELWPRSGTGEDTLVSLDLQATTRAELSKMETAMSVEEKGTTRSKLTGEMSECELLLPQLREEEWVEKGVKEGV